MNDGILQYTIKRIRFKASQMVGKHGFTEDDFEDLRQELMLDVLRRLPKFNSGRADIKIFISTVINNRIATLIERQEAECRDHRRVERSLDEPVPAEDDDWTTFGDGITEAEARSRLGLAGRSAQERADLAMDVAVVLDQLDEGDRRLCLDLHFKTPLQIARETGIRRAGIYERIARIRGKFIAAGLHRYL